MATLPDPEQRIEANKAFVLECRQSIVEIEEAMRPTLGKVVLGSLVPLFGAGFTVQATDSGNVTGYAGAALSLAGAAYLAIASIRGGNALRNRPLAYVVRAVNPGVYDHPAAMVEDMYRPQFSARTATGKMEVTKE